MTTLFTLPKQSTFDTSGDPLPGARLYFYETGTSTPQSTFSDADGNTPHSNPVVADAYGTFPAIWLGSDLYRVTLVDEGGVTQWTVDDVGGVQLTGAVIGAALYQITDAEQAAGLVEADLALQYQVGNVLRYGADPTGASDSSVAIQSALSVGGSVYFPRGTYDVNTELTVTGYGRVIYGDGPELSIINLTSTNDGFVGTQQYTRVTFRDLGITGDASSGRGIYFNPASSGYVYDSLFENLTISVGKQAIFLPRSFSITISDCHASSTTENVFEVMGSNSTLLQGCYAHNVPASKYGYRIYGAATLVACNGIDTPSNSAARWGLFGQAVSKGDAVNTQYRITMIGCNVESWSDYGIQFRYDGNAQIINVNFTAKGTGTYEAVIYIEYCSVLFYMQHCTFQTNGATRNKQAYIYADNAAKVLGYQAYESNLEVDQAGTLIRGPGWSRGYPEVYEAAHSARNLEISNKAFLNQVRLTGAASSAASGVVALGNGVQTTVGAAGTAAALPAQPTGYLKFYLGSTQYVIPYYRQA